MIDININVDGQVQMKRSLDLIDKNVSDLTPFWGDVLDLTENRVDEVFESEGRNIQNASPWAKLSPKTIKAREKGWGYYGKVPRSNKGIDQPLRWSGRLQDSRSRSVSPTKASFTMEASYALWHQRGSDKTNLPRRLIIDFNAKVKAEIVRAMQKIITVN